MPNRWLLKTEPESYSFDDLMRDGKTRWDGVSNPLALKNIRAMKKGDVAFVYHTGEEKAIVGIAEVASDPYPDPKGGSDRLVVFDIVPKKRLKRPIPLSEIKSKKLFSDFDLVKYPRLSVMPVKEEFWSEIMKMGER
jgi:predicted RNA-binding protein with PUA-like domain